MKTETAAVWPAENWALTTRIVVAAFATTADARNPSNNRTEGMAAAKPVR